MSIPNKIKHVRPETMEFIEMYKQLKGRAFKDNKGLAQILGYNSAASITEIVKQRQNIDPDKFLNFKNIFDEALAKTAGPVVGHTFNGIPMYNELGDLRPVGYMNFPGLEDCDLALPVWGQSMAPFLENGCWVALKEVKERIAVPGEVYYIEWAGHRMFKRLVNAATEDVYLAHSDNTRDMAGDQLRYPPFPIRRNEIKRLWLVRDIHKKHNH